MLKGFTIIVLGAGIVREPMVGYQDDGILGGLLGVYIGGTGVILKPASGLLKLFSSTATGVGSGIRQLGDEVVRVPHTRIRNPRSFGIESGGAPQAVECFHLQLTAMYVSPAQESRTLHWSYSTELVQF